MKNRLIVALDVNSFEKAKRLVDKLAPYVGVFKVGSELFVSSGPKIINYVRKKRKKIFLDLKFFDIPNTVERAVMASARHGVFMLTLHVKGGFDMLKKAVAVLKGRGKRPLLIGVTVLTSKSGRATCEEVVKLAKTAKRARLDGIVCSARETAFIKKACGRKFLVINPGIRPLHSARDDQRRVATPAEAIKKGADFIVIGRPITRAKNPAREAKKILEAL